MNCCFLCVFYSLLILVVFSVVFRCYIQALCVMILMMFATDPFNSIENVHHDNESRRENYAFMLHVFVYYIQTIYYFSGALCNVVAIYTLYTHNIGCFNDRRVAIKLASEGNFFRYVMVFCFTNKEKRESKILVYTTHLERFIVTK